MKVEKTSPQGACRFLPDHLPVIEKPGEAPFHMYMDIGVYGVSGMAKRGEPWSAPVSVSEFERYLIQISGYRCVGARVVGKTHIFVDEAHFTRLLN